MGGAEAGAERGIGEIYYLSKHTLRSAYILMGNAMGSAC